MKSLLLARVEIPSDRGGSLLSSETRLRARKENVNQTSWVRGKDGVLRVLALLSPPVERGGKRAKGEVSIGYMNVCVCVCVFDRAVVCLAENGPSMQMQLSSGVGCFVAP